MKKTKKTIIIIIILLLISVFAGLKGWIIYSAPEYHGRIIDAETKQPLQNVVIVAVYYKFQAFVGFPPNSTFFKAREALTDEKGEFIIPALTTFLNPFYVKDQVKFIIYKPGYSSYNLNGGSSIYPFSYTSPEYLFQEKLDFMVEDQLESGKKVTYVGGVVELYPLKTKEERIRSIPSPPESEKETPLLFKAINDEEAYYGLGLTGGK